MEKNRGHQSSPEQGLPMVTNQPGLGVTPGPYLGTSGLEYLAMVDQLIIKQNVELEVLLSQGLRPKTSIKVLNSQGQVVFTAVEDTGCFAMECCCCTRPFEMNILDNVGQEVLHLVRPLRCQHCCFPCCLQELEVHSPPGTIIGSVEQQWSIFYPKFIIKDDRGNPVMKINGPFCACECCSDLDFIVTSATDGSEVGKISKQWSGLDKEIFTDADNFGINFPMDLDVKVKATLLGAAFLIDFIYIIYLERGKAPSRPARAADKFVFIHF